MAWTDVMGAEELTAKGKALIRRDGLQVLILHTERGLFACANRCPHEGYPLREGALSDGCVLTCNWHNWKFDLSTGETLVGGDRVRRFPVSVEAGRVLLDLTPEDPAVRIARARAGLLQALDKEEQDRLVRESARLLRLGVGPETFVADAVCWAAERQEFGTQHAIAASADWLALYDRRGSDADRKLAAIGEVLGHIAEDARGGRRYPFPAGEAPWSDAAFRAAIEREDEAAAIACLRGGLATGMTARDFLPSLAAAALEHYADFGHSLIYSVKTAALAARLDGEASGPLLLMLARHLIYMTREDELPEFRDYRARRAEWGRAGKSPPLEKDSVLGVPAKTAMATVAAWSAHHAPRDIYAVLVEAAAWMLLHVDEGAFHRTDGKIADNVNWLDFTHALTFAEAGLAAVRLDEALWPPLLLQLACFIGRNHAHVDRSQDVSAFAAPDPRQFEAEALDIVFDHGADGFILSAHLLKTLMAGLALAAALPEAAATIRAALNRLLHARVKRRHILRAARQMRAFVAQE
ncbi:MAG: Rieske (2Fe-2S) protein [Hyphomonadaceae bacterium]